MAGGSNRGERSPLTEITSQKSPTTSQYSMVFSELPALVLTGIAFWRWCFRRDPGRALLDRVPDIGRAVQFGIEILVLDLGLGTDAPRAIAKQTSFFRIFFGETVIDCFGAQRPAHRVDEDVVLVVFDSEHVRDDVFRDSTLLVRADPPIENNVALVHVDGEVVDVERAVRRKVLAHQSSELVVAQVIDVVNVFEVAGHVILAAPPDRRTARVDREAQKRYEMPIDRAGLFLHTD